MDFQTKQAIGALVEQIADLQDQVARVQRAAGTPQLVNSSITGGALRVVDADGTARGSIGYQPDGTVAVVATNGPPPPAPSTPSLVAGPLTLTIVWDGLFAAGDDGDPETMPLDFDHVQVHLSTDAGFEPDATSSQGTLRKAGALVCTPLLASTTYYVVLVGINTSGIAGDASAASTGVPDEVVATDILDGIVTTLKLADGAVTNAKIGGAAVDANKLADGSVSAAKVVAGAIGTTQLGLGAVDVDRLADGSVDAAKLASAVAIELNTAASNASAAISAAAAAQSAADAAQATADGAIRTYYQSTPPTGENSTTDLGDLWFDTDTNQAYRWNGTDWILIEDNSIAEALAAAQNAQTTADGKIVSYWQATAPAGAATGDLWYDTANGNRVSWWTGSVWQLVQMGTAAIQADAITANLISAGAVGTSELAANSVIAGKIAAGTVGANELAANSVIAGKIAAGVVDATAIAAGAVTTAKLDALAVTSANIAANAIVAGKIDAGAVTAASLSAGAIDGKTITGATILTDSATGGFFVYSGTPTTGNLIVSVASAAGTDAHGNNYPQGMNVTQGEIDGTAINAATLTAGSLSSGNIGSSVIIDSDIQGGTIENADITFDSNGGTLLVYASTTTTQTLTSSGNYTVPAGVTSLKVECWGGGGGGMGGSNTASGLGAFGGNGGGGGGYAKVSALAVTPGSSYPYAVGAGGSGGTGNGNLSGDGGDTSFNSSSCVARGGTLTGEGGGTSYTGVNVGDVTFAGGGTGLVSSTGALGGGGSAGPNSSGHNSPNNTGTGAGAGGTAVSGGGAGGAGGSAGAHNGTAGGVPGGGGGGGGGATSSGSVGIGGSGARGQIKLTYLSGTTLIASISGVAGTDQYGNSYPAGISGKDSTFTGTTTATGNMAVGGVLTAANMVSGNVSITPIPNTPTSVTVTYPALTGSSFAAFATANTGVIVDTLKGYSVGTPTATSVPVFVYRTNNTATTVYYQVIGK